jgi:hypothetical protein
VTITIQISCTSFKLCISCDVAHNSHASHIPTTYNHPWTCDNTQTRCRLKLLVWCEFSVLLTISFWNIMLSWLVICY